MAPFKDSYILVEILFMHAAKGAQEIAQAGPDTFHGVVVDFANAVSILIPRPASLARRVTDRFMVTLRRRQMPIGPHSSVLTTVWGRVACSTLGSNVFRVLFLTTFRRT